ncbi:MAG: hypothetical protein GY757_09645 [bacterium]|nr:hypothetical protein [bacterium]
MKKFRLLFLVIMSFAFFTGNIYSALVLDYSEKAFSEPGDSGTTQLPELKRRITWGAGLFLKSQADMMCFSRMYELSDRGIDYSQCRQLLERAMQNLRDAKENVSHILKLTAITPYKKDMILMLRDFNYNALQKKHALNRAVFDNVSSILSSGDIATVYITLLKKLNYIEKILIEINGYVETNRIPELSLVWRINEAFSQTHLFGQYVTRVFHAL